MIRRGEAKQDDGTGDDEKRVCHTPGCGATFRPVKVLSGESTEYHCSGACAALCLKARGALAR